MKITTKIIMLMLVVTLMLVSVVLANMSMDDQRISQLFLAERDEASRNFGEIVRLAGSFLQLYAYDYTCRDEMVTFAGARDPEWAKENIDPSLNTYKANAAWVYDPKFNVVYHTDTFGEPGKLDRLPVSSDAVKEIFSGNNRFCHFFAKIPQGLMEIRGASIHPGSDEKRKSGPKGYFFAGKMVDRGYVGELSEYLGGMDIALVDTLPPGEAEPDGAGKGALKFSRALKNWNGEIVAYFLVSKESVALKSFRKASAGVLTVSVVFMVTIMAMLVFFLMRWISSPLNAIFHALEKEETAYVARLLARSDEFGRIAQLIDNFFSQRKTIVSEMERRRKIEEELNAKITQLKQFKDIAVGREIRMIELKKEVNELSKELGRPEPYDASF